MSAEPWRRSGTPVAPRLFVWQAWYFGGLRLELRGRCGTLETFVDVRGTLATKRDPCGAAAFCVAGVVLWGPQAGFAWQVWYFGDLCRCPPNLGDEAGPLWRRGFLRGRRGTLGILRLDLRGRCGTFEAFVDVRGTLATKRDLCGAAAFCVAGVVLWGPQAGFAWQVWYFRDLCRCPRNLGDEAGPLWRRGFLRGRRGTLGTSGWICVAGVVLWRPL